MDLSVLHNLNFGTYYSYSFAPYKPGKPKLPSIRTACFSGLFSAIMSRPARVPELTVNLKLITSQKLLFKDSPKNHYCIFSRNEIKQYMTLLKQVVNFSYKIFSYPDSTYVLQLHFINTRRKPIKFIVTTTRYLYEFPYSYILKETLELRKLGYFPHHNFLQQMYLVSVLIRCGTGHSIFDRNISLIKTLPKVKRDLDSATGYIQAAFPSVTVLDLKNRTIIDVAVLSYINNKYFYYKAIESPELTEFYQTIYSTDHKNFLQLFKAELVKSRFQKLYLPLDQLLQILKKNLQWKKVFIYIQFPTVTLMQNFLKLDLISYLQISHKMHKLYYFLVEQI